MRVAGFAMAAACYAAVLAGAVVASIGLSTLGSADWQGWHAAVSRFVTAPTVGASDRSVRPFLQTRRNTCGPAALAFALRYYDIETTDTEVAALVHLEDRGTNMLELARAAEHFGMQARGERLSVAALGRRRQPTLVHLGGDHFAVVVEARDGRVLLFDPARGLVRLAQAELARIWNGYALSFRFPAVPELDGTVGVLAAKAATAQTSGGGG